VPQIIVLSDIHGNLPALEAVWHDFRRRPVDRIFCLGDLAAFGPFPEECVSFVRERLGADIVLMGNTDRYLIQKPWSDSASPMMAPLYHAHSHLSAGSLDYLAGLPPEHIADVDGLTLHLVHGVPTNDEVGILPETPDTDLANLLHTDLHRITCGGHTHIPCRRQHGKHLFVNPGSIGYPFDGDTRAAYARLHIVNGHLVDYEIRRVTYDVDSVVHAINAANLPLADLFIRRLRFATHALP
jgi:putative phosphoesterase